MKHEYQNQEDPEMKQFLEELDDFLDKERDQMDQALPANRVWEGIRSGLKQEDNSEEKTGKVVSMNRPNRTSWWVAAAAVVARAFAGISQLMNEPAAEAVADNELIYEIAPELRNAEVQFASTVSTLESAVLALVPENYEGTAPTAFLSDLETAYEDLKKEALETGMTEEVVLAMIKNYRLRIYLLEKLLTELEEAHGVQDRGSILPNQENESTSTNVQI